MRDKGPTASDAFSSRSQRSQQASPMGSPRGAKHTTFGEVRLTERQQMAIALEQSKLAAQATIPGQYTAPEPQRGSRQQDSEDEPSPSKSRPGGSPLRRGSAGSRSEAAVSPMLASQHSDDDSSAGPSGRRDVAPVKRRPEPNTAHPSRKHKLSAEILEVSSTSELFSRAGHAKAVSTPVRVAVKVKQELSPGLHEKANSSSESSRQSHSTSALPIIRVSSGRRIVTDSSDSDSPYASPAGSQGPHLDAQQLKEEDDTRSQHSSGHPFARDSEPAQLGASHSQAPQDVIRAAAGNTGEFDASPAVLASGERRSVTISTRPLVEISNATKRTREPLHQEDQGSFKRAKVPISNPVGSISPVRDAIPAVREPDNGTVADSHVDAHPGTSGRSLQQDEKPAPASSAHDSDPARDPQQQRRRSPHGTPTTASPVRTPSPPSALPRSTAPTDSPDPLPAEGRHISLANGVRIALSVRPPTSHTSTALRHPSPPGREDPSRRANVSHKKARTPAAPRNADTATAQPAAKRITIRKPTGKVTGSRRSGRVAALDSPSEPSSPLGQASDSAHFLSSPPASPTRKQHTSPVRGRRFSPAGSSLRGKRAAESTTSLRPPLPRGASLDANYAPPASLSRGNSNAGAAAAELARGGGSLGQPGAPVRTSSRAQASIASMHRKLRSQEPVPQVVDPYAKPPIPKRIRAGGLQAACARLRTSDGAGDVSRSCSLASSAPSSPSLPPLSDSLSKSLAARAAQFAASASPLSPGSASARQVDASMPDADRQSPTAAALQRADSAPFIPRQAPTSPFAGFAPQLAHPSASQPLADSMLQACKSLEDVHTRESCRWDGSGTAQESGLLGSEDGSIKESPSPTLRHTVSKQPSGRWSACMSGPTGRLSKALQTYASRSRDSSLNGDVEGIGSMSRGCRSLSRPPSFDLSGHKAIPALFRSTSNELHAQSAYEDLLQRHAMERDTMDGLASWLGHDHDAA